MFAKTNNTKNDFELPSVRGERLRRLRNMANLTREALCSTPKLNASTYKGWEIGRFGGLSVSGAKQVVRRVAEEGVICSLDWLLYGEGTGPFVVPSAFSKVEKLSDNVNSILQEVTVFQNNFSDGIFLKILDDGNFPQYKTGDYVAGIKKYGDDIKSLSGQICIVQTVDNGLLLRQLFRGETDNTYMLLCPNPETTVQNPILYNECVISVAPVIRHYKNPN